MWLSRYSWVLRTRAGNLHRAGQPTFRIDPYTSLIQCDLPQASGAASLLRLYNNGAVTPSDTFFTSTDLHFGSTTVATPIMSVTCGSWRNLRPPDAIRRRESDFPDEPIHSPAAIVTTGDNAHDGQQEEVGALRLLYEQSWISE